MTEILGSLGMASLEIVSLSASWHDVLADAVLESAELVDFPFFAAVLSGFCGARPRAPRLPGSPWCSALGRTDARGSNVGGSRICRARWFAGAWCSVPRGVVGVRVERGVPDRVRKDFVNRRSLRQ